MHRAAFASRLGCLLVVSILLLAAPQSSFAHSRGMGTLDIAEQGPQLLLTWVFYYDELPAELTLPDGSGRRITLRNAAEVEKNMTEMAEAAFRLKQGDKTLRATKISRLLVLPDKTCLVIINYPAQGEGPIELQAPVLRLLPANYLINVRFRNSNDRMSSVFIERNSAPLVAPLRTGDSSAGPEHGSRFWTDFTAELGTPWIHANWILLAVLSVLSIPVRRLVFLFTGMIFLRAVLVHLAITYGIGIPWRISTAVLCLPIFLSAWLATRETPRLPLLIGASLGAGALLTLYDVQFLPVEGPGQSFATELGYASGFLAGLVLIIGILSVINAELKELWNLRVDWRRKACWAVAGASLWISIYSLVS